ncbi:protein translocase subunit SecD [Pararhodobacter sp. SW119]|uniref:protein translocase subunit SecD n=1 Tax=Pararhodobacter sp. SW119 TaxID=2780075 RepID=UPI001AE0AE77|nr:protein translocase subunit SecD [Pararhodobacter sp. SW119]
MRRPFWVLATYALLLILGLAIAVPNFLPAETRAKLPDMLTEQTVALGLDLQGGAHLLLAVDRPALAEAVTKDLRGRITDALAAEGLPAEGLRIEGAAVTLPASDAAEALLKRLATEEGAPGAPASFTVARDGERLRVATGEVVLDRIAAEAAQKSLEVIRHRIDAVGVSEPQLSRVGQDRILVQLPGVDDPGQLRELLGATAQMSFHLVAPEGGDVAPGSRVLPMRDGGQIAVQDRVALAGTHLSSAALAFDDQTGRPVVSFRLDSEGARIFGEITAENVGQPFAIVLDGQVLTAPVIREPILGGQGQISGQFTPEEAQTLAVLLNSGALPASLEVIEERTVGAALGADSIRAGLIAGAVGLGLVVVMMVGLYGAWGLLASAVLGLNVALTLAALGLIGATLTLPGIAGIILCLGIAVDANILIFSRIREETARGAGAMKALAQGYARAWGTILDANVTTLLAMVLLFTLGAGAIRGFAVTMSLGILISMFTAITLMRIVMEAVARGRRLKRLEVPPLFGGVPRPGALPFLRHGRVALAGSAVLSVLALAALVWPGPQWGIDFTGGIQMTLGADGAIPMAELRAAIAGLGDATLQGFGTANEVLLRLQGAADTATLNALQAAVRTVVPGAVASSIDLVGPTISGELLQTGAIAMAAAVLAMLVYLWLRFEGHFAAVAMIVLALDVTKTLGVVALIGWEVNLPTLVAMLTLIGYSVNDKVVVCDRVRENRRADPDGDFAGVVERSLNQVLARCIFTSATTLAALLPMALWGGAAVSGFAWPMIAGVVIATASSLLVTGPLLTWAAGRAAAMAGPADKASGARFTQMR